jgi:hypothetical protein
MKIYRAVAVARPFVRDCVLLVVVGVFAVAVIHGVIVPRTDSTWLHWMAFVAAIVAIHASGRNVGDVSQTQALFGMRGLSFATRGPARASQPFEVKSRAPLDARQRNPQTAQDPKTCEPKSTRLGRR